MPDKPRKPWLAGVLTLVTRGLGHLYAGYPARGLILFGIEQFLVFAFAVAASIYTPDRYLLVLLVIIGLAFNVLCIVDAVDMAKTRKDHYETARYNRWFVYAGYVLVLSAGVSTVLSGAIKSYLIKAYHIPAASMEDTLLIGDHILVDQRTAAREPKRGDLVVFAYPEDPSKEFVKRVVAVEGDTVEIRDKVLLVNGSSVPEPYVVHNEPTIIPATENPRDNLAPVIVPAGSYFTMGDNRDRSYDSRFWGFVPSENVKGTVRSIYWSWDRTARAVRWDRIGMKVL